MKKILLFKMLFLISIILPAPEISGFLQSNFENTLIKVEEERKREEKIHQMTMDVLFTIKFVESNNRYHVQGLSGEYGAYQFTWNTWKLYSYKYFGKLLDITNPKHQDKVAYQKVRDLIESNYTLKEIASIWNSGSPYWRDKVGINKHGVYYNVERYVKNFEYVYFDKVEDSTNTTTQIQLT